VLVANKSRPSWHVKVADFGLSKNTETSKLRTRRTGSGPYIAPELLKKDLCFGEHGSIYPDGEYSLDVDEWSLGVMMFELLTGHLPFPDGNSLTDYVKQVEGIPDCHFARVERIYAEEGLDLIRRLLNRVPEQRVKASAALCHIWFSDEESRNRKRESDKARQKRQEREQEMIRKKEWEEETEMAAERKIGLYRGMNY
jgi:serine/threonine protein kinase